MVALGPERTALVDQTPASCHLWALVHAARSNQAAVSCSDVPTKEFIVYLDEKAIPKYASQDGPQDGLPLNVADPTPKAISVRHSVIAASRHWACCALPRSAALVRILTAAGVPPLLPERYTPALVTCSCRRSCVRGAGTSSSCRSSTTLRCSSSRTP